MMAPLTISPSPRSRMSKRTIRRQERREQGADSSGRAFSSLDNRRSAYGETDWHQQAEDRFAVRTAEKLDEIVGSQAGDIVVIAPPRMLGELRRHYGRAVRDRLITEIPKDMVGHETADIGRLLANFGD